jgi:polar amino acid transport system permease protein
MSDLIALVADNQAAFLNGLWLTIELVALSSAIALTLAVPIAIARASGPGWANRTAYAYTYLFRGTPLLTQLFLLYYGLAQFEAVRTSPLWPILKDPWPCALIVLSLNMSAYAGEVLRGGIAGVPLGEREAALAMGMPLSLLYRRIILPRAFGIALPALGNEVIIQLKGTALVSTITLLDLTGVARRISTRTYSIDALIVAGLIYLILTWMVGRAFRLAESRMNRHRAGGVLA